MKFRFICDRDKCEQPGWPVCNMRTGFWEILHGEKSSASDIWKPRDVAKFYKIKSRSSNERRKWKQVIFCTKGFSSLLPCLGWVFFFPLPMSLGKLFSFWLNVGTRDFPTTDTLRRFSTTRFHFYFECTPGNLQPWSRSLGASYPEPGASWCWEKLIST